MDSCDEVSMLVGMNPNQTEGEVVRSCWLGQVSMLWTIVDNDGG